MSNNEFKQELLKQVMKNTGLRERVCTRYLENNNYNLENTLKEIQKKVDNGQLEIIGSISSRVVRGMDKFKKYKIFDTIEKDIHSMNISDLEKKRILENLLKLKNQKVNLLITGATGCGKSSTINALFNMEMAKVGVGTDPETMDIKKYELDNLILWDSPGLGDGKEADDRHTKNIIKKLSECDSAGKPLIDIVLVILDGSSRDLGTSYDLINKVIIPHIGKDRQNQILVAINQADMAMKGRCWNYKEHKPEKKLEDFLEDKVLSVKRRIKEGTGVDIEPIYYSAGYKEDGKEQRPYNLSKLLYLILKNTPQKKRLAYVDNISQEEEKWKDNDGMKDYSKEIQSTLVETIREYAEWGSLFGEFVGDFLLGGETGKKIGSIAGSVLGSIVGLGKATLDKFK